MRSFSDLDGSPTFTACASAALVVALTACGRSEREIAPSPPAAAPGVETSRFGDRDGREVKLFTLQNRNGLQAKITDYGAILVELWVPDADGALGDVVLGFDSLEGYVERNAPHFGSTVGRVANRIAGARFELAGESYELAANDGPHHLHGGRLGFDRVLWQAEPLETGEGPALRLTYVSADGEEGYPGRVEAAVVYTLTNEDELRIEMSAVADRATPVNMAHHTYWNLEGHDSGPVLDHVLELRAAAYTPADRELIPTGDIAPVAGTPFDFTDGKPIGRDLEALRALEGREPNGFDHNFVVDGEPGQLRLAARLRAPASGRELELWTDQPGVQLYTGNFLDGVAGKRGASYGPHAGLCLETQAFPDAIHHRGEPGWSDVVLGPGELYRHLMVVAFR